MNTMNLPPAGAMGRPVVQNKYNKPPAIAHPAPVGGYHAPTVINADTATYWMQKNGYTCDGWKYLTTQQKLALARGSRSLGVLSEAQCQELVIFADSQCGFDDVYPIESQPANQGQRPELVGKPHSPAIRHAGATMLPRTTVPRGAVPRSAVPPRTNQVVRRSGDAASLGLPTNWAWDTDPNGNPVVMSSTDPSATQVPVPPGATQWGRARPLNQPDVPGTPVPLDANGYAVVASGPSTGIMVGLTVLGLVIGYGLASSEGGTIVRHLNPIRHLRRLHRHMRRAHRF